MERFGQPLREFLEIWDADTLFMFLCHDYAESRIRENLKQIQEENSLFDKK